MAYRFYDFKSRNQTKSESFMIHDRDISIKNKLLNDYSKNMVKNSRHSGIGKKCASHHHQNNALLLSTGDQGLNGKLRYNNKTPVYVHDFKTNYIVKNDNNNNHMLVNSNVYTYGFQDYLNSKSKFLKSKFDSLTLMNKSQLENNSYESRHNQYCSNPSVRNSRQNSYNNSGKRSKAKNNKNGIDETVINQLEESYWANWRPNNNETIKTQMKSSLEKVYSERIQQQSNPSKNNSNNNALAASKPKPQKKVATPCTISNIRNECIQEEPLELEIETAINVAAVGLDGTEVLRNPSDKPVKIIHESIVNSYNADSNCSEEFNLIMADEKRPHSFEFVASRTKLLATPKETINVSTNTSSDDIVKSSIRLSDTTIKKDLKEMEAQLAKSVQPHLINSGTCMSDQELIRPLKHTDSFIITSRKQNAEKSHYPQPKCIKLQKNANALANIRTHSHYIRGGSYPLKSCLKKEKLSSHSLILGKPGSPMLLQPNINKKMKKFK